MMEEMGSEWVEGHPSQKHLASSEWDTESRT